MPGFLLLVFLRGIRARFTAESSEVGWGNHLCVDRGVVAWSSVWGVHARGFFITVRCWGLILALVFIYKSMDCILRSR